MTDSTPRKFAVRRLNPFEGVTQVVDYRHGRALSSNGIHWEIQVMAEKPDDLWGAERPGKPQLQYLRFGTWSQHQGLRRVPAHPLLNMTDMMSRCELLVKTLQSCTQELPFPLEDNHELWLLDGENRLPLALLASHTAPPSNSTLPPSGWQCARANNQNSSTDTISPYPASQALDHLIRVNSGQPLAQWFRRDHHGNGTALPLSGFDKLSERSLAVDAFPELLLRESWDDAGDSALVESYLNWLSPFLLMLQHLDRKKRRELEKKARLRAVELSANWHLYPEIVDETTIKTARVEARLRHSNT